MDTLDQIGPVGPLSHSPILILVECSPMGPEGKKRDTTESNTHVPIWWGLRHGRFRYKPGDIGRIC